MKRYRLSSRAIQDIFDISYRIALDNEAAAAEVERAIYRNCELIAASPRIGRKPAYPTRRPLLVWPALPYENYQIVYEIAASEVKIARVLHAARLRVWNTL